MDFSHEPAELIAEFSRLRTARGLSYQSVADACGVSQSTIIRVFNGETEPSYSLLQKIASAVQYNPEKEIIRPPEFSRDGYIAYLQDTIIRDNEDHNRRVMQLQAHYNMILYRKDRIINMLCLVVVLIATGFIVWLIIDITHPDIGLIKRDAIRSIVEGPEWTV